MLLTSLIVNLLCISFTKASGQPGLQNDSKQVAKAVLVTHSEDSQLLLSIHLDGLSLSREINAYQYSGGVLVPLGQICRLLEIAVTTNSITGIASGYVRKQDLLFTLDVPANKARLGNIDLPFAPTTIEIQRSDIYIDAGLLSKWFGLGFKVDIHSLDIQVKPIEPLPVQRRLLRMRQMTEVSSEYSVYHDPGFPRVTNPYLPSSGPAIDQTLSMNIGPSGTGPTGRYTALVAADLEHQGLTAFLQLDTSLNSALTNLSLGQMDPDGSLLGKLHAREFEIGQFYVPSIPLISDSHLQSGLLISNYPLNQSLQFDVTSFSGILLPGWDVQLFRGAALFDYQPPNTSGRYDFKNVPLVFGLNPYLLVFNGPGGEHREEAKSSNVGNNLVPPGQSWYRFAVDPFPNGPRPITATTDFGLTSNLSASLGLASSNLEDGLHVYSSAGLHGYVAGVRGFANLVTDSKSGSAQQIGAQWLWKQATVEISQVLVERLISPVLLQNSYSTATKTTVQIGNLSMPVWSGLLPTDIYCSHERGQTGNQQWEFRDRLSYQKQGLGITNWIDFKAQSGQPTITQGQLLAFHWSQGPQFNGAVNYSWGKALSIDQVTLNVRKIYSNQRVLSCGLYETPNSQNVGINATLTRNIGTYTYGYTADVSSKGGLILGLSLSYGAVRRPDSSHWAHSAQSEATMGAIQVRVFMDTNGNGKYDRGEPLLNGVGFWLNRLPGRKVTSKDGIVLVDGLTPFVPFDLQVAESTLGSPLWISKRGGVRIIPRPGNIPVIDFPIACTGQVTGTVFEKLGTETLPKGGITLELIDSKGHFLAKQISAYDGFFTFLRIPVGAYVIRPIATSPYRADGTSPSVLIPQDGAYLDGVKVVITYVK